MGSIDRYPLLVLRSNSTRRKKSRDATFSDHTRAQLKKTIDEIIPRKKSPQKFSDSIQTFQYFVRNVAAYRILKANHNTGKNMTDRTVEPQPITIQEKI